MEQRAVMGASVDDAGGGKWALSNARGTPEYLQPWRGAGAQPARIASAAELIRLAYGSSLVSDAHRERLLRDLLWDLTEADGKYRTRYRSEGTRLLGRDPRWRSVLQHEHVVPRKDLRRDIRIALAGTGGDLDAVLGRAVGCVVTREEHSRLSAVRDGLDGWERYRDAGVAVWDLGLAWPTLLQAAVPGG